MSAADQLAAAIQDRQQANDCLAFIAASGGWRVKPGKPCGPRCICAAQARAATAEATGGAA